MDNKAMGNLTGTIKGEYKGELTPVDVKLMKDYFLNPNQTISKLAEKHGLNSFKAGALVSRLFKLNKEEREKLFFGKGKGVVNV